MIKQNKMRLQQSSEKILNQLNDLILSMDEIQYVSAIDTLSKGSVGAHVRHIIEFYQCLLNGLETKLVNYDLRQRNQSIETDVFFAGKCIVETIEKINNIDSDAALKVALNLSTEESPLIIDTTFYRELAYNIEHAIHHMAIIKIGIYSAFPSIKLSNDFGLAFSTINYNKSKKNVDAIAD